MVKPATPAELLARIVTRQGGGKILRLRRGVTAEEIAEAIKVVQLRFPKANLRNRLESQNTCLLALIEVTGASPVAHGGTDWDLVVQYAHLRDMTRHDSCCELGLANIPNPRTGMLKSQYVRLSRLVSSRGAGTRRMLKKHLQVSEVRWALRAIQEVYPDTAFIDATRCSARCWAVIAHALRMHDPPWEPRIDADWDLLAVYMRLTGVKDRLKACSELGLNAALPDEDRSTEEYEDEEEDIDEASQPLPGEV